MLRLKESFSSWTIREVQEWGRDKVSGFVFKPGMLIVNSSKEDEELILVYSDCNNQSVIKYFDISNGDIKEDWLDWGYLAEIVGEEKADEIVDFFFIEEEEEEYED